MKNFILIAIFTLFASYSYGQFSDCAGADAAAAVDISCGATHNYATNAETASGFFSSFSPSCDAGGANQIDYWFKFTAFDDDISVTLETGSASTKVVILDNVDCGAGTATEIACMSKTISGAEELVAYNTALTSGTDYFLVVLMDAAEDIVDICIKSPDAPSNNECADAIELFDGASVLGTNLSTESEAFDYACTTGDDTYDVWYKFDYTADNTKKLRITVTSSGISGSVSLSVYEACEGNEIACDVQESSPNVVMGCLPTGMYWIQVASADLNEGDFNIIAEVIDRESNECNENDECVDATEIVVPPDELCQWYNDGIKYCVGFDACPDAVDEGTCDVNEGQTVFFKVFVPLGADEFDVKIVGADFGDPDIDMIVMDDCAGTNKWCGTPTGDGAELDNVIDVSAANNQFYYIAVNKKTDGTGTFNIQVYIVDFPENDDPCLADPNPPYDLGTEGTHIGNTCCAIGVGEGADNEPANKECSSATEENIVWYRVSASDDGLEITVNDVSPGGTSGNVTVEVYVGAADAACDQSFEYRKSSCTALPSETIRIGCLDPADFIWIKIGTSDGTCGKFEISVEPISDCDIADTCGEVGAAQTVDPVTVSGTAPEFNDCLTGCLDLSCPDDVGGGCDFTNTQTVWYQVNTDGTAGQLFVNVIPAGTWAPMMSIYLADPDCTSLVNANTDGNPCSATAVDPAYYSVGVAVNSTYYVAVTSQAPITDDPNFEICFGTIEYSISCSGELGCSPDPTFLVEVTDREYPDADDNPGGPFEGPFCPGEELSIHLEFEYDASQSTNDWFLGFVPGFSNGFNVADFDFDAYSPTATGGDGGPGVWSAPGSGCDPAVMYEGGLDHLGTYYEDGIFKLCNSQCEPCPSAGMEKWDELPGMYAWLKDGSNIDCIAGDCAPVRRWGIGSEQASVSWDFTIKVKEYADQASCEASNGLRVDIQAFSDGTAGCYDAGILCVLDQKQIGPIWPINCNFAPKTTAIPNPAKVCSGEALDITVSTEDGLVHNVIIIHDDMGEVDGMNDQDGDTDLHIGDVLTISDPTDCDISTVFYYARVDEPEYTCKQIWDTIEVEVYPLPVLEEQDPIPGVCYEELPFDFDIVPACTDRNFSYTWVDDLSGLTGTGTPIVLDASFGVGHHVFTVEIKDLDLGCSAFDEWEVDILPPIRFELKGDTLCWGEEHEFIPNVLTDPVDEYTFLWEWDSDIEMTDETYLIESDEYGPIYEPGEYQLCLTITEVFPDNDDKECPKDTCVNVWIRKPFDITYVPTDPKVCDVDDCVDVTLIYGEDGLAYEADENSDDIDIIWNLTDQTNNRVHEFCGTSTGNEVQVLAYGCDTIIEPIDIGLNTTSNLMILGDSSICAGDQTTLTVEGDFVSYEWSTSEMTKSITVSPGVTETFTVVATNDSGCTSNGSVKVVVSSADDLNIPSTPITFCTGSSTTYTAAAGYMTYKWYKETIAPPTISTQATVNISLQGNYILVATSNEGCEAIDTLIAQEDANLSPSVYGESILCYDQPTTFMYATGGDFTKYEWRFNNAAGALVIPQTNKDTIELSDGQYYLYVEDANGCTGDIIFNVIRKAEIIPVILPSSDTVRVCHGENTMLIAPSGYSSYEWDKGVGRFNDTLTTNGGGTYILTVTDSLGCKGKDTVFVKEYPEMFPTLKNKVEICSDQTVTLSAGSFANYEWKKDDVPIGGSNGKASIDVSEGGIYSVIVYNEINCPSYDTTLVIKTDKLTPKILNVSDLCGDDNVVLSCDGAYFKYTWTNSAGQVLSTADSLDFSMTSGKDVETITLEVETELKCAGSDQVTINRYFEPKLDIKDNVEACGDPSTNGGTTLDFSTFFNNVSQGYASNTEGTWRDLNNSGATHNADWSEVKFASVPAGSVYGFEFTTNTAHAPCNDVKDTLFVKSIECNCDLWNILPIADVCNGEGSEDIDLSNYIVDGAGNKINPVPSGKWTVIDGTGSVVAGNNFKPANASAYTYVLKYTLNSSANYCEISHQVSITVQQAVSAGNPIPAYVCEGVDATYLLDSLLVDEDLGGVWSEVSVIPSTGSAFDAASKTFSTAGQVAGIYKFKYFLDGIDPCSDDEEVVTIEIQQAPVADAGSDVDVCYEQQPVTILAKSDAFAYSWTEKGSDVVLGTSKALEVNQSGTYVLKVSTEGECFDIDEVDVLIRPELTVELAGKLLLVNGEIDTLTANVTGRDADEIRLFNWTKDGEPIEGFHGSKYPISEAGNYCVEVEGNAGCLASDCVHVSVSITKTIDVPNVFSPDGDGTNDQFFIKDGQNVEYIKSFKIFDRWGELVYSDGDFAFENRKDHYWNGKFNGKEVMQGVYVYFIEFIWSDKKEDFVTGDITIIR